MPDQARNVAILLFNDVEVLDFAGPFEVFSTAGRYGDPPLFNVYTIAVQAGPVLAVGGLSINPQYTLETCPPPDILLIPGGQGTRPLLADTALLGWIYRQAGQVEHLLSVCTGALLLARAGLLDGMAVTTHHSALDLLSAETTDAEIVDNRRYVDNGKIATSAGISAGIDLALHMVAKLAGREVADAVAANMEYDWRPQPVRTAQPGVPSAAPDQDGLPLDIDPGPWTAELVYQPYWEAVERDAARWLWADGPRFDLRPEFFRRQNVSRSRRLPEEPADPAGCYLYALDAQDRVIFARYHYEEEPALTSEYFYQYLPDRVEVASYSVGETLPTLQMVSRLLLEDGHPRAFSTYVPGPPSVNEFGHADFTCVYRELYTYHKDKLTTLRVIQLGGQHVGELYDEAFVYDDVGRLDYIHREYGPDNAYIVYQRPQRGQTVAALRALVQERLLDVLPEILDGMADEDDPLYCLAMVYDLDDENCLPPVLALGSVAARALLIDEHGEEASNFVWDPEEFQRYGLGEFGLVRLDERDEELDDACFMLNQQLSFLNNWDLARALLNDVARVLMQEADRPGVTQDFVIYAVDRDFDHFDDNFEYSVPAERVEALAAEGLF